MKYEINCVGTSKDFTIDCNSQIFKNISLNIKKKIEYIMKFFAGTFFFNKTCNNKKYFRNKKEKIWLL